MIQFKQGTKIDIPLVVDVDYMFKKESICVEDIILLWRLEYLCGIQNMDASAFHKSFYIVAHLHTFFLHHHTEDRIVINYSKCH